MGAGSWDSSTYATFSTSTRGKKVDDIYASRVMDDKLDPKKILLDPKGTGVRESRDSDAHPQSNAIIVGLDVTGSMGMIADEMAKNGLGILFNEILDRKPVTDPHIMFMGIGDVVAGDKAPLQISQFEADNVIVDQLTKIYLEHAGGGNDFESYNLPWYFAAMHTSIDCFEKRKKKGYLFTIGDEQAPDPLTADQVEHVLGARPEWDRMTNAELLTLVGRMYDVFHIIVAQGQYARRSPDSVRSSWTNLLGQRALWLEDYTKLSQVIVSAIEVNEGRDRDAVAKSWGGDTALVVRTAIGGLTTTGTKGDSPGVTRL